MSNRFTAGSRIYLSQLADGKVSAYIEYIFDETGDLMVRTVDFELEPTDKLPGSKEWMLNMFAQLTELL